MDSMKKTLLDQYAPYILGLLLLVSFVIKYIYVFDYTDYTQYLFSDMGGYWERALESLKQGDHAERQWAIWPPFSHMTLAWFFKFLSLVGLSEYRLESVLTTNILLSVLSTLWVYLIALKLYPSKVYALLSATIYAFFFPLVYLNAFVLSEHLSVFALLASIVLILYARDSWMEYLLAGVILAFSVGMRANFGPLGLPLFVYLLLKKTSSRWRSLFYAISFSTGFFLFLLFIVTNNHANSNGKMSFLSAGGGISYYLAACKPYELVTDYDGYEWTISAPAESGYPEYGIANHTVPFYHQKYYYDQGKLCQNKQGITWIDRLKRYRSFFEDSMFPYRYDAALARAGIPLFSQIALGMTFLLFLVPWLFFQRHVSRNTLILLTGLIALQFALHYYYAIEQRYLYGFFFAIVLLSVLVFFHLASMVRKQPLLPLSSALIILSFFLWKNHTVFPEERAGLPITMSIYQDSFPLKDIDQKRHSKKKYHTHINTISFKNTYKLIHDDLGDFGYEENFFIDFDTSFRVLKEGDYTFVIAFDDGFKLSINQQEIMHVSKSEDIEVRRKNLHLTPGSPIDYRLSYYQGDGDLGIRAYYEVDGKRFFIGEDSSYLHFSQTDANTTH